MVRVAFVKEEESEPRVACSPETAKKLVAKGCEVVFEQGAGLGSHFADALYTEAGATSVSSAIDAISGSDVFLTVGRPTAEQLSAAKQGAALIGMFSPTDPGFDAIANSGLSVFSMEFLPRITRAQSMDVLSSQSNLAGYKAVIDSAATFGRAFPMMMTAAGTVAPAKVFIMGVGVAGLQAIATARRLGAITTANDIRPETEEQVQSLGAKFIKVEGASQDKPSVYARELTDEEKAKQAEVIAAHLKSQDVVITTALIPGRPAPRLISKEMVESMAPGSVILDMAAERGGNCELTQPGETITHNGVIIVGAVNLAGALPTNASSLYARNLLTFLETVMIDKESGELNVAWDDEIVTGTLVAKDGKVVHPRLTGEGA